MALLMCNMYTIYLGFKNKESISKFITADNK